MGLRRALGNFLKMFNPRGIFAAVTLVLVLGLIFEWNSSSKNAKLQDSVAVQNTTNLNNYEKITNGTLEIFIDLKDGSVKEAYLFEKQERDGLYKTRLLSNDSLLKFYFKTSVSGFKNESSFVVTQKQGDKLTISSSDLNGNLLEKTFYFDGANVLKIDDGLELVSSSFGNISAYKTFYRNKNKSIDYGVSFSRDHLAYSTSDDVFNDEQITSIRGREDYLGNWIGYSQKHFVVAVFDEKAQQKISLYPSDENGVYRFGFTEEAEPAKGGFRSETSVFLGPKQKTILESVAPHFKYNLDLGFVYGIGEFLIVVLNFFYGLVGNWGFAIVLLTLLFKLLLSPLQIMQINSMVKMRRLQPKIQEIQNMHKNDQQKLGMEMMQLYKKEKFNPLAGCFPMIPQIPIFLAMFWVTREAFEFRGESFLWIPDLAESDPYMIAPVLMGAMMYLSQLMMPKPPQTEGMQAQISRQMMIVFPPMLTLIFLFMPAGVVIYSVINMALSIVPQAIILRRVDGGGS